uniref:Uncharacterized protein n=1 Tax=Serinus canaria TaxID=9135 RepID=A0A8C9UE45_SERCA
MVPQVKPAHEAMTRRSSCKSAYDLQSPPHKREKSGPAQAEQRRSCHILYDGSEGLGLHTWDRYTELGKRGQNTLPALSRVPSAADQNYIILAPLNPGSQLLRPVYQEDSTAVGELWNGSKGKSHTGSGRKSRLMKTVQSMKSYGNYQNCTIVRPHIPHSYGTYVTLAPKVLVFPIFVQVSAATGAGCAQCPISAPGSAQLGIHARISLPAGSLPCSALLWSWLDLAQCWGLSQRESCPGQAILCWIFSPPLQLSNLLMTFSLPVFPLRQKSECLLSLEAYSQEQKKRICWCLAENITKQQHPAAAPTESKVREPQELGIPAWSTAVPPRTFSSPG